MVQRRRPRDSCRRAEPRRVERRDVGAITTAHVLTAQHDRPVEDPDQSDRERPHGRDGDLAPIHGGAGSPERGRSQRAPPLGYPPPMRILYGVVGEGMGHAMPIPMWPEIIDAIDKHAHGAVAKAA